MRKGHKMIENRKNIIAKAFCEKGLYKFWEFVLDNGQDLEYGDIRIPAWSLVDTKVLERILKEEKKRLCAIDRKRIPAHRVSRSEKVYASAKRQKKVFVASF